MEPAGYPGENDEVSMPDRTEAPLRQRPSRGQEALTAFLTSVEAVFSLSVVILISAIPVFFIQPITTQMDFPLETQVGVHSDPDQLLADVQRLELTEQVDLVDGAAPPRLRLRGIGARATVESEMPRLLQRHGFAIATPEFNYVPDLSQFTRGGRLNLMFGVQAAAFLLVGGILTSLRGGPWGLSRGRRWVVIGTGVGMGFAAFIAGTALAHVQQTLGVPVHESDMVQQLIGNANLVALLPWFVLIIPISEEVFFRGYLFRHFSLRLGLPAGYILSALLFAFVHFNPSGFLVYAAVGALFAYAYQRTGNLMASMLAHCTYNGIVMAFITLGAV